MSGWGCPHELDGRCQRVDHRPCDPGMKGCVLFGRFNFSTEHKNRPKIDIEPSKEQGSESQK